jgi:hypothetical protein
LAPARRSRPARCNFSLETTSTGNGNGIFGTTDYGMLLATNDFTAAHNPLWFILTATIPPSPPPGYLVLVPPNNDLWPAMPWPGRSQGTKSLHREMKCHGLLPVQGRLTHSKQPVISRKSAIGYPLQ